MSRPVLHACFCTFLHHVVRWGATVFGLRGHSTPNGVHESVHDMDILPAVTTEQQAFTCQDRTYWCSWSCPYIAKNSFTHVKRSPPVSPVQTAGLSPVVCLAECLRKLPRADWRQWGLCSTTCGSAGIVCRRLLGPRAQEFRRDPPPPPLSKAHESPRGRRHRYRPMKLIEAAVASVAGLT